MHGSSHVCMKDCELCASTWLQPTNAEFVSMRFFFICSWSKPGSICVSQRSPTYKNTRSVNCFVASPKALVSLEALASWHFHRIQAQILHSGFTSLPCSESRLWSLIETTSQWQDELVQATIKLYMYFGNAFGTQIRAGNLKSNRQITEGGYSFGVHVNNLKTKPPCCSPCGVHNEA